ncbi:4Fe-4S dicluster domain-containing protein [Arcanobacterium phocae]|uniref:4Fe-4S dicluster domain-containing protein n=1 Tax=Arcanobacterium phocae TaxID=131112 RepID=UPI001C0F330E|nr:4Fe-4S dicluster domain-containing protein [Arcanobacterium phocae]
MRDRLVPLLRWVAAQDPISEIVLQCPDVDLVRAGARSVVVVWDECVTSISLGTIAQLVTVGASHVVIHPCRAHTTQITERVEVWNSLMPGKVALFDPVKKRRFPGIRKAQTLYLGHVPVPRRAILGLRIDSPIDCAADDQERTMQALRFLGIDALEMKSVQSPKGIRLRAKGCIMCAVCVKACPHDALAIRGSGNEKTLWHNESVCRGCRRCESLCPVDALSDNGSSSWADTASQKENALATLLIRKCASCGVVVEASAGDLCALCAYRREHPFESVPLELMKPLVERLTDH